MYTSMHITEMCICFFRYLRTLPVVPSQIVHDIDVCNISCYIHATWCVGGREIGASSCGMYWNSVLIKGGSNFVCH